MSHDAQHGRCPRRGSSTRARSRAWSCLPCGGAQGPHGWGTGDEAWGRQTRCRHARRERGERSGRAVHDDAARPGGPAARVRRARKTAAGTLALGDGVAQSARAGGGAPVDGTRRRARPGGERSGHPPRANAAGAYTDGTRGVAGGHPASPRGRPHGRAPSRARGPGAGRWGSLPVFPHTARGVPGGAQGAVAGGTGTGQQRGRLHGSQLQARPG
jgi:hypothetical protein